MRPREDPIVSHPHQDKHVAEMAPRLSSWSGSTGPDGPVRKHRRIPSAFGDGLFFSPLNRTGPDGPVEPDHDRFGGRASPTGAYLGAYPVVSGLYRRVAQAVPAALVLLWATTLPVWAQRPGATPDWGLQPLMTAMRHVRASSAHFVETRYLHLLNQAQRSSGRLTYVAPDHLWKETTEPVPARLTIEGDRLTMERQGERTQQISLQDYSEIGALVDSVRATLAGDLPALTRHFTTALEGDANSWTLTLTPREAKLKDLVTAIRIRGEQAAIHEIETAEADGDHIDMAITPEPK